MTRRRGPGSAGVPSLCAAALLALACAAGLPGPAAAKRATVPPRAAAERAPLCLDGLVWDMGGPEVARALHARGFTRAGAGEGAEGTAGAGVWRGGAFGQRVRLESEPDRAGRLVALTLRFEPSERGSALQRYSALVAAVRRRHGPWTVQVEPGRPVDEERFGRFAVTRRFGPLTAATMWTDAAGAAAAVQLDGAGVLWLRYESPRWEAATREREDAER